MFITVAVTLEFSKSSPTLKVIDWFQWRFSLCSWFRNFYSQLKLSVDKIFEAGENVSVSFFSSQKNTLIFTLKQKVFKIVYRRNFPSFYASHECGVFNLILALVRDLGTVIVL